MFKTLVSAGCGLGLLLSSAAMAAGTQTTIQPARGMEASRQVTCRPAVHEGELLPRLRQCYSQQDWQTRQKQTQQQVREIQIRSLTVNNGM